MRSHSTTSHFARDRVNGVLLGLAAGDRNGGPIQLALQLAHSVATLQRFDATAILRDYLAWWQSEGFDTGPIAAQVFTLITSGIAPDTAVLQVHAMSGGMTAGCNPAHRAAPLAMAAFLPDHHLAQYAYAEASLTHHDHLAGDVAAAVVTLCRALIHGVPWLSAIQIASTGRAPVTIAALQASSDSALFHDGYAPHVLHAAVQIVQGADRFASALDRAIAFAGPANYCPVLVGAIGGARWGAMQVDPRYLVDCKILADISAIADTLAQPWPE